MKKAVLFRIKNEKKDIWYAWCRKISTVLKESAKKTLEDEEVIQEIALGFDFEGDSFVIGYAEGEMLPANQKLNINVEHKAMKEECLEMIGSVDILYSLRTDKERG